MMMSDRQLHIQVCNLGERSRLEIYICGSPANRWHIKPQSWTRITRCMRIEKKDRKTKGCGRGTVTLTGQRGRALTSLRKSRQKSRREWCPASDSGGENEQLWQMLLIRWVRYALRSDEWLWKRGDYWWHKASPLEGVGWVRAYLIVVGSRESGRRELERMTVGFLLQRG